MSLLQNLEVVLVQADENEVLASDGPSVVTNSFISDFCILLVMATYSVAWSPLHPPLSSSSWQKAHSLGQSWDRYEIPDGPKHLALGPDVGGKAEPVQHSLDLVVPVSEAVTLNVSDRHQVITRASFCQSFKQINGCIEK